MRSILPYQKIRKKKRLGTREMGGKVFVIDPSKSFANDIHALGKKALVICDTSQCNAD